MVIYNDGNYQTLSTHPDDNFVEMLDCFSTEQKANVLCVITETTQSELADIVRRYAPNISVELDGDGNALDILYTEEELANGHDGV